MSQDKPKKSSSSRRHMVVAMVLGTAMSAISGSVHASPETVKNLTRYCTVCWQNARLPVDRWEDCTQEVFVRLLERVPAEEWERMLANEGDERREFLRAIDAVKKRVQRSRKLSCYVDNVSTDHRNQPHLDQTEVREEVVQKAGEMLTARQQEIIRLTLEGLSVCEISEKLELCSSRVSDEKYKATRKLRAFFLNAPVT